MLLYTKLGDWTAKPCHANKSLISSGLCASDQTTDHLQDLIFHGASTFSVLLLQHFPTLQHGKVYEKNSLLYWALILLDILEFPEVQMRTYWWQISKSLQGHPQETHCLPEDGRISLLPLFLDDWWKHSLLVWIGKGTLVEGHIGFQPERVQEDILVSLA